MTWYVPRKISEIKFGGQQEILPNDLLPKPTSKVFDVEFINCNENEMNALPSPLCSVPKTLSLPDYSHESPFTANIVESKRITGPGALKTTYAVKVQGEAVENWEWMPGDAFGILCQNDPEIVQYALDRLQLKAHSVISLKVVGDVAKESFAELWQKKGQINIKLGDLFRNYLDFSYFPKKACLKDLSNSCSDSNEAKDLLFLASRSGSSHYLKIAGERTTILDFLNTFPSCRPSLELLLRHLPLLHPRYYSICNCKSDISGVIEFVFNSIEYSTPEGLHRKGLCSSWLERQILSPEKNCTLDLVPRPNYNLFRPPTHSTAPLVMICAGTGISPFIGFLRYFSYLNSRDCLRWLFYGFRDISIDYLFKDELDQFLNEGILTKISIAVSRQPELNYPKYVQNSLSSHIDEIFLILSENLDAKVYICGDELTMIKDVNSVFINKLEKTYGFSTKDANALFLEWSKAGRVVKDVWV